MNTTTSYLIRLRAGLLLLGVLALSACGSPAATSPGGEATAHVTTVQVGPSDTPELVARQYGARVLSWQPEAGLAILGLSEGAYQSLSQAGKVSAQNTSGNPTMRVSRIQASGFNSWAGGWNSWAGGWNSWAGGWNSWAGGTNAVPAPPSDNQQAWAQIDLYEAYQVARNFGAGVRVAVIDTGLDTAHPMFSGRLAPSSLWRDFVDGDADPQEAPGSYFGHGTAVAGVISQIAPRAQILPIRVLSGEGTGSLDQVIQAIDYAAQQGAQVINLSLGTNEYSWPLQALLRTMRARNVYVVASVGNSGSLGGVEFPARMTYWDEQLVFGVTSSDVRDVLSGFSNYGPEVLGTAPGEGVASAYPGNRVGRFTGTSFAAPMYAGALALALGDFTSSADRYQLRQYLLNGLRRDSLYWQVNNARGLQSGTFGQGVLDLDNTLRSIPGWTPVNRGIEFIGNGGFERGNLTSWFTSTAQVVRSPVQAGGFAAQLQGGEAGIWQEIRGLQPNTAYRVTAWVRSDPGTPFAELQVYNYDGSAPVLGRSVLGASAWTQFSLSFRTGPNNTSAAINIYKNNGPTMWVDGVSVREVQ